jgi:hypothetical protein
MEVPAAEERVEALHAAEVSEEFLIFACILFLNNAYECRWL